MKGIAHIINILALISLVSCKPGAKLATPPSETAVGATIHAKDSLLTNLFSRHRQLFDTLIRQKEVWQMQVIYTQIDRNGNGKPRFTTHTFNLQPDTYFYPASTVKFPAAVLALQKLNELGIKGLDKNATMITAATDGQPGVANDPNSEDGRPTIANYIKKILLVSDNDAFNRLYEFLGQEYLNTRLQKMGYDSTQLIHRLSIALNETQNRTTNAITFYETANKILYAQPEQRSWLPYQPRHTFIGNGYRSRGKTVNQPFDFSTKNRLTLPDLHSMLTSIIFPDAVAQKQRFGLSADDYNFLYKYMSMKPSESRFPQYASSSYPDGDVKFLLFGGEGRMENPLLRIFNKVGDAYGFLTDAAYVVDFEKGVEFLLSATIYCNSDGIFNDDRYDYNTVGFPFMKNLGQVIYEYELQRSRKHKPDLSAFRVDYTKED